MDQAQHGLAVQPQPRGRLLHGVEVFGHSISDEYSVSRCKTLTYRDQDGFFPGGREVLNTGPRDDRASGFLTDAACAPLDGLGAGRDRGGGRRISLG
jgi:hypothetical protein